MDKQICIAQSAGFCYGVARALSIAEETVRAGGPACTLGPLIHNRHVVRHLESMGLRAAGTLDECPAGITVIVRSHGVSRAVWEEIESRGHPLIDATCPFVARIAKLACAHEEEGRQVLILGDPDHPEVQGIVGWCRHMEVVRDAQALADWLDEEPSRRTSPLSLFVQTTAARWEWEKCKEFIKKRCTNGQTIDTMCKATTTRQEEAKKLAAACDLMVVVGDPASSNTRKLADLCENQGARVLRVQDAGGITHGFAQYDEKIGLTAGASTPPWIIQEVSQMMEEMKNTATEPQEPQEESFADMLESSLKTIHNGDKVTGIVTAITPTEIHVDLGTKHAGYIPVEELSFDPIENVADFAQVGNPIEAQVVRVNDVEGTAMLSKRRLETVRGWDDLEDAREAGGIASGIVTEENKGGLVVNVKGIRVFVPASQTGLGKDVPMSTLLRTRVNLRITDVNRARRRVVGSIRAYLVDERRMKSEAIWESIEVGKHYQGTVKSMTSYGAFVDIGGVDGMVHVSELSWSRVKQPSDVIKVGDKLDVYVLSLDKEKKRISLGHKNPQDNPWEKFIATYKAGDTATAKIVKLMAFGAFAEVMPGVDGLIHISQLASHRVGKPSDVVQEGQEVTVQILDIDLQNKKISLSMRALLEQEAQPEEADAGPDQVVAGADETGATFGVEEDAPAEE